MDYWAELNEIRVTKNWLPEIKEPAIEYKKSRLRLTKSAFKFKEEQHEALLLVPKCPVFGFSGYANIVNGCGDIAVGRANKVHLVAFNHVTGLDNNEGSASTCLLIAEVPVGCSITAYCTGCSPTESKSYRSLAIQLKHPVSRRKLLRSLGVLIALRATGDEK